VNVSKEPRSGLRFPRTAKLLKHSDFQRVYKSGKRHFSGLMTVFYLPRPDAADVGPRIGITVSRALGGAVERNRIKRRLREAIRLHLSGISSSMDVVFNPKKIAATAEFTALEQEVSRSFEVIGKAAARMSAKERSTAQ
jgi:ribonuclease P protein component